MNYNNRVPYQTSTYTKNNQQNERALVPFLVGGALGYGIGAYSNQRPNYYPVGPIYPVGPVYPPYVYVPPYYRR